jgi:8-oxo-dGTP pyrophosphatase MutT (NUDIX family)
VPDRQPRLVTTGEAARAIGVAATTLQRWVNAGRITPTERTLGGHLRWDLDQLRQQIRTIQEGPLVTDSASTPEAQPVVAAIVTSDRGLLVTWRNDKVPPAGFLTGEIEPGESPEDAMIRECKEEAGLRVTAGQVIGRRVHPKTKRTMIYVAGEPVDGADVFVGDSEELADVRWVSLDEADEAFAPFGGMFPPVHEYVRNALS